MEKYQTMTDFTGTGIMPILKSVVTAIPPFFEILLFVLWLAGTAASYFAVLKLTGRKRFFHSLTAMSWTAFLGSLALAGMNDATFTYLNGYWVGFYILAIVASYFLLEKFK